MDVILGISEAFEDFEAVDAWQHDIEDDKIRLIFVNDRHDSIASNSGSCVIAFIFEVMAESASDRGIIFDDENFFFSHRKRQGKARP